MLLKNLIVGLGDIGTAIKRLIFENIHMETDVHDPIKGYLITKTWILGHPIDVLHICIPLHDEHTFISSVLGYIFDFRPKFCVIHSTTKIHTCEKIQGQAEAIPIIHMPVRGSHADIVYGLKTFDLFVGSSWDLNDEKFKDLFEYLNKLFKVPIHIMKSTKETALAKLLSVVWFGLNIAYTQEAKLICEKEGIDFTEAYTKYFATDNICSEYFYDRITKDVYYSENVQKRPIFYPSFIGGKCVIQDTVLMKDFGITKEMYEFILKSNERFRINDEE